LNEAAVLPGVQESQGVIRRFRLAPRLTPHVRHRLKYIDMPVLDEHAFVFAADGHHGGRARSVKEFLQLLRIQVPEHLEGHLRRHDFSRWIGEVFRDRALASHLFKLEARVATDDAGSVAEAIGQALRARYEPADRLMADT
jgi:hypothetical protein